MAGFTDGYFRRLCRLQGADEATTELVSAKGYLYGNKRTRELLDPFPGEGPLAAQLFGREPAIIAEAAMHIAGEYAGRITRIDLNMGCPAPKVTRNGEGSALMKEPELAGRITEAVARYVNLPVSVKFRKGWDGSHVNAVEFAHILEESGASLLCIHGRTRDKMYAGRADWDIIGQVKARVSIPVIGNGDVDGGQAALELLSATGCDGVMVGRAALGNPWVFGQIKAALASAPYAPPSRGEIYDTLLAQVRWAEAAQGKNGVIALRKQIVCYLRGVPGASRLRIKVNGAVSAAEIEKILLES